MAEPAVRLTRIDPADTTAYHQPFRLEYREHSEYLDRPLGPEKLTDES